MARIIKACRSGSANTDLESSDVGLCRDPGVWSNRLVVACSNIPPERFTQPAGLLTFKTTQDCPADDALHSMQILVSL